MQRLEDSYVVVDLSGDQYRDQTHAALNATLAHRVWWQVQADNDHTARQTHRMNFLKQMRAVTALSTNGIARRKRGALTFAEGKVDDLDARLQSFLQRDRWSGVQQICSPSRTLVFVTVI